MLKSTLPFFSTHEKPERAAKRIAPVATLNDELKSLLLNLNNVVSELTDDSEISEANFKSTKCNYYEYQDFNNFIPNFQL